MSRSRRQTPITGWTCAESEKDDKRFWHRRFRRIVRSLLRRDMFSILPSFRQLSNPWNMAKDGKQYLRNSLGKPVPGTRKAWLANDLEFKRLCRLMAK